MNRKLKIRFFFFFFVTCHYKCPYFHFNIDKIIYEMIYYYIIVSQRYVILIKSNILPFIFTEFMSLHQYSHFT